MLIVEMLDLKLEFKKMYSRSLKKEVKEKQKKNIYIHRI